MTVVLHVHRRKTVCDLVVACDLCIIAQEHGIGLYLPEVVEGRCYKFGNLFGCRIDCIDELIVGISHIAEHMQRLLVGLDHAKGGRSLSFIHSIKPRLEGFAEAHILRHKLEVFEAAFGDDELDVLNLSCGGISCELSYLGDAVIRKPLLKIRVECTSLEEAVSKEHHAFIAVACVLKFAHIKESFAIPYHVLNLGFFLGCNKTLLCILFYAYGVSLEFADLIGNDKDRFLREPDCAFDATECQGNIRLPRCLIRNTIRRKSAGTPIHHSLIEWLSNEQTPSCTA